MPFAAGALVKARGREWVVLPESTNDLLVLRPLGGTDEEKTGIYLPLENVSPAQFSLPDPAVIGDHRSCRLLRDALRLGFRSSTGPFRSLAGIAAEPRPYQLVPLLMALRLEPVRLLIADDVGIGKTIEACLIARELKDRGEIKRLAVICPPHLAEQWQLELVRKFHIHAELVLPGAVTRLEKPCRTGQSLFDLYPHVVVSVDFIKSDRRRDDFLRTCPEFVIVDEAHTCTSSFGQRGGNHQRHELLKGLAEDPTRHLVLVTATPHSGNEEAFRSLLGLLNKKFADLPDDLQGPENERHRRELAAHFVQRRRADIRHYMDADTPFPEREEKETQYTLSPAYKQLFARVVEYARESVREEGVDHHRQRVRWWSALALLRALASSPSAAAATLRSRSQTVESETADEADAIGRRTVLDLDPAEQIEAFDLTPGADTEQDGEGSGVRARLLDLARQAEALEGEADAKLQGAIKILRELLHDGFHPIVFCRFIATAEYLATELRKHLPSEMQIMAVTGLLPPSDREARVLELGKSARRLLVCTDCLSEGINLQEHFDAVLHYDLSWNPTRHEQREGRVDRFNQPSDKVRVVTYYGRDNQIDGIVLEVLIRKHRTIRNSLGISVPIPVETNAVIEAIMEGLLLRGDSATPDQQILAGFEEYVRPARVALYTEWDNATAREKRSRTVFAQHAIKVEEVKAELQSSQVAAGSSRDVRRFVEDVCRLHGVTVTPQDGSVKIHGRELPRACRDISGISDEFIAKFELPVSDETVYLTRTHPIVEGLASFVLDTALDPALKGVAHRAGVIRTRAVQTRTTLLLLRLRFHILALREGQENPLLAEEAQLLAFEGSPGSARWLTPQQAEALLDVSADQNINRDQAEDFVRKVVEGYGNLVPAIKIHAKGRADELLLAHRRVRDASKVKGVSYRVEPQLPADVLGLYVFLPTS